MSNATIIQTKNDIFIGADSATSILIDGILYRQDTNAKKIYLIDNMVIFCSGELHYCYKIMEKFQLEDERNVESLRTLIVQSYQGQNIEVVVCEYDGKQTIVYQLSPYNNFRPTCYRDIPEGGVNLVTAGIKTRESHEIASDQLIQGKSILDIYKIVFDSIAYEGIGGTLCVYRVNKSGINRYLTYQIKENNDMNKLSLDILSKHFQRFLIVGERIYGKIISGVNLAIEDESGIFKIQGSKTDIFDRNGRLVMKMGLVDEEPDTFGLWAFNDITRVRMDDRTGIAIERKNNDTTTYPNGWEKVMWTDVDGTLYAHDLVAENIKIVNNIGKTIVDAENNYLDLGDFESIVMDSKLSTIEKMQIITELYKIEAGYNRMIEQANRYIRSERDALFDTSAQFFTKTPSTIDLFSTQPLTNAYTELLTYMEQYIKITNIMPLNIDFNDPLTETTSKIADRTEFILKFKNYYDAEKDLRNKIEDAQFYSGLNMGQFYNNVVIGNYGFIALRNDGKYRAWLNATNGLALQKWENNRWVNKVYAAIGSSTYEDGTLIAEDLVAKRLRIETRAGGVLLDATSLQLDFSVLDYIILDDVIMSPEKITLANQYKSIVKQYNELQKTITRYITTAYNDRYSIYSGLAAAKNQLEMAGSELLSAFNALTSYLTPIFLDMNAKTHIVNDLHSTRTEFYSKWEDFYKTYENGRNKLSDFLEMSSLQLGRNYNNTVIDAENGIVVTRGNMMNRTILNATDGIKIEQNVGTAFSPSWQNRFYVDLNGNLFADQLSTKGLKIIDGKLGDAIIFDWNAGITINGLQGEQIRLNANEGIAIDSFGEQRFWVHTDGTLRARNLVVMNGDGPPVTLPDGSFISQLRVSEVRTLDDSNPQDHVWVENQSVKFISGNGSGTDEEKMAIYLDSPSGRLNGIPTIRMGVGSKDLSDNEVGYIVKDDEAFKLNYKSFNGNVRRLWFHRGGEDEGILMESVGNTLKLKSDTKIILEIDANNYIEVTPNGVKIVGIRIDLN